ncbi:hypothetical protein HYO98_gp77, partial [Dinoroseobacter phage DS-1410Ws-06]
MSTILKAWNAGFVVRWHTNVRMNNFEDRNNAHQHRVGLLLLQFFPWSSREAIIDAFTHDQGEVDFADVPYPIKRKHPIIRELGENVETESIEEQGLYQSITKSDKERRAWCDLLDSYLWMLRCVPTLRHRPEWIVQYQEMEKK